MHSPRLFTLTLETLSWSLGSSTPAPSPTPKAAASTGGRCP